MAAEALVSPIVDLLLGKLGSFAYQQVSLISGLKIDLQKLQRTLTTIKAVLLDAEEQQLHNRQVGVWLEELKDVCYDAEDVFDEFQAEALRRQVLAERGSIPKKVCNALSWPKSLAFRFNIGHKIKDIRERLDEIASNQTKFGFTNRVENRINFIPRHRETHSFVVASEIIGREKDKEEVIKLLMDAPDDKNVSVIPIVGIAGLGKTALAKLVYNDKRIDEYFDLKLWVCVSNDFLEEKIMRDIIKSEGQNHNDMSLDRLQKEMRDILDVKDIGNLKALRTLSIGNCPNLVSLPSSIKYLSSLENLYLSDCEKLNLDWGMGTEEEEEDTHQDLNGTRPHLGQLGLSELPKLVELPQWLLRCSANTLQRLGIRECHNLLALPDSLQNLKSLLVRDCPQVSSLPQDMHGLTTLEKIEIWGCPTLSERCQQGNGEDWPQIAHVPNIWLDGDLIIK
ncbi:hypothetical protein LWI29_037759 [Acer saccharum]|uniref:Uncharacterized protein n=1 Tax=Acer saccharum TaxID=4024 RepID=A0AA39SWJ7_ACESA|nr:hypothetical protein LWI29_037759 [Acer saccharum]